MGKEYFECKRCEITTTDINKLYSHYNRKTLCKAKRDVNEYLTYRELIEELIGYEKHIKIDKIRRNFNPKILKIKN